MLRTNTGGQEQFTEVVMGITPSTSGALGTSLASNQTPPVTLFSSDATNGGNETLPFRGTTYEAKYVHTAPLLKGNVYIQDPNEIAKQTGSVNLNVMTLSQLYSAGYNTFLAAQRRASEVKGTVLPPAPPDFDGEAPTNPEIVSQYVQGIASAYNSIAEDPTPYEMFRHVIEKLMETTGSGQQGGGGGFGSGQPPSLVASAERRQSHILFNAAQNVQEPNVVASSPPAQFSSVGGNASSSAAAALGASASSFIVGEEDVNIGLGPLSSGPLVFQQATGGAHPDAMNIALLLGNPMNLNLFTLETVHRMFAQQPELAKSFSPATVEALIQLLRDSAVSVAYNSEQRNILTSVLCRIVLSRRQLGEVLLFAQALESMPQLHSSSIVPVTIPMIPKELITAFSFGPFTSYIQRSPLDVLHQESTSMATVVPEGATVTRFAVTKDGKTMALATGDSVYLCDAMTGELHARAGTPCAPGASCWSLLFNNDESELLFSDSTGKHHSLFVVKGLTPAQKFDFEEPHIPRFATDGSVTFAPSPALPSGRPGCLRLVSSDRINFPLPLQMNAVTQQVTPEGVTPVTGSNGYQPIQMEEFHICAVMDASFQGIVCSLDAGEEIFSLQMRNGAILLSQGAGVCHAVAPSRVNGASGGGVATQWVLLCASWKGGAWTLMVNSEIAELRGVRNGQSKVAKVTAAYGLCGTGLAASVACWAGPPCRTTIRTYAATNVLQVAAGTPGCRPLFHIPLDEGGGVWLKETVTQSVIVVNPIGAMWDMHIASPFVAKPRLTSSGVGKGSADSVVRLPPTTLLQCHVLQSNYQVVLVVPSSQKGADSTVLILDSCAARIISIFNDSGTESSSVDTLLFLNSDETYLYSFVPRFSAFTCTQISSVHKRAEVLQTWLNNTVAKPSHDAADELISEQPSHPPVAVEEHNIPQSHVTTAGGRGTNNSILRETASTANNGNLTQMEPPEGTAQWIAHHLYRVLYTEGTQFLRFPPALCPISAKNMFHVSASLRNTRSNTPKLKTLAMLTLGIVHFVYLSKEQDPVVQHVAALLNTACKQIEADHRDDQLLTDAASELFRVGVSRSLTPAHKAEVLCSADHPKNAEILESYLAKESIGTIVHYLSRDDPKLITQVAQGLLRRCELERSALKAEAPATTNVTSLMLWFVLAVVQNCTTSQRTAVLREVMEIFLDYTATVVNDLRWGDDIQKTAVHSAAIPLFIVVSEICPAVFDDGIHRRIRKILQRVPSAVEHRESFNSLGSGNVSQQAQQNPAGSCASISLTDISELNAQSPAPPSEDLKDNAFHRRSPSPGLGNARLFAPVASMAPPKLSSATQSVVFSTRQACDVIPSSQGAAWRLLLDLSTAASISIAKEPSSSDVTMLVISPPQSTASSGSLLQPTNTSPAGVSTPQSPTTAADQQLSTPSSFPGTMLPSTALKKVISNVNPTAKLDSGGKLLLFGYGENSLTAVCQFELKVDTEYKSFLQDALTHVMLSTAKYLLTRAPPCDVFLAPLMRHGLNSTALARHGIQLPSERVSEQTVAMDVLRGRGDGKAHVDEACRNMRGIVTQAMRPAVQALLSILIHAGCSPTQAEDELKLRWFSGEWGSKLQGEGKEDARQSLIGLADWMITNVNNVSYGGSSLLPIRRASSSERRVSDYLNRSSLNRSNMSVTSIDRRTSTNSSSARRSTAKTNIGQSETLDQVRALFSKGVTPEYLEEALLTRTRTAMANLRGLDIILSLLAADDMCKVPRSDLGEKELGLVLDVLWEFLGKETSSHVVENLVGAGGDLEMAVRTKLHAVLALCSKTLLEPARASMVPFTAHQRLHNAAVPRGKRVLQLLAILCHPWDATDCDFFVQKDALTSKCVPFLANLEELAAVPIGQAVGNPVTSPWRGSYRRTESFTVNPVDEKFVRAELLGIADDNSLSRIYPNMFSITVPGMQFSRSDAGITIERVQAGSVTLRADEGWPMSWRDGVPRIFYYEVTLQSPVYRLSISLSQVRQMTLDGKQQEGSFSYENTGFTNDVGGPPYGEGDTVGCGVVTSTRRAFFTLNGVFLGFVGRVTDKCEWAYPTIAVENRETTKMLVNFGTTAFHFDFRQLHPSLCLHQGPTMSRIASTAAVTMHVVTARACMMSDLRRSETKSFVLNCCSIVCEGVNHITSSLMTLGVGAAQLIQSGSAKDASSNSGSAQNYSVGGDTTPATPNNLIPVIQTSSPSQNVPFVDDPVAARVQNAVTIAFSESLIMKLISTLRHIVRISQNQSAAALVDDISSRVFDAASVLMLLPLHSVKIAILGLLPEILPIVRNVSDEANCATLVKTLVEHAKWRKSIPGLSYSSGNFQNTTEDDERIPFVPAWTQCDSRCMSITHTQHAQMVPEAQRSIVLGTVLPRTGIVSFTVRITRENMTKGHSLKGGYFVGVAIANLAPLSPPSNSQSWKVLKPPVVWALHDTSPQLPHAVNPTVRPNNFQRTFGSGDVITVVVNRDAQTISFYRDEVFLKELYQDVPQNLDLAPFAQLYNDDATVVIGPGEMTPAITAPMLLSAAAVDVLRSMFTLRLFEYHVADHLTRELQTDPWPSVALSVFASLPDPRCLTLRHGVNDETFVVVRRVSDMRCKFTLGDVPHYDHVQNLRTPSLPSIKGKLDVNFFGASVAGISKCIDSLVSALSRLVTPLVTTEALESIEQAARQDLYNEERDAWDTLFIPRRCASFDRIINYSRSMLRDVMKPAVVQTGYVFSQGLSHSGFVFSPRYCGRLVTVPNGAPNTTTPFIAIAEPSVPISGKFSIRCQLIRGHHGQILGGGYYFGVCAATFTSKRRDMNVVPPDVWALHDMDDTPWRLRHLTVDRRLPTAAEPNCLLVSGDIVRLEIDRDEGTVHAYRKPANGNDEIFVGFLYDNLPKGVELFPFVHMYNTDAVAVILPSSPAVQAVRTTVQQPHFALALSNTDRRCCDGCVSQHRETKLQGQEWFKCNECVDYNLCIFCFNNFVHSHHSFTRMDGRLLVHTRTPPTKVIQGTSLIVPGSSSVYLKSVGCVLPAENMNCLAESKRDDSMCIWGLVSGSVEDPCFSVAVEAKSAPTTGSYRPAFIGVGEASEILALSVEELRTRCVTGSSTILSICSDSRVRRKFQNPSLCPFGFVNGSTVSICVVPLQGRAKVSRDWIDVGYLPLPYNLAAPGAKLVGFVLFGFRNMVASLAQERSPQMLVTVSDVINGELIRVTDPSGNSRYCSPQDCRVPVIANVSEVTPNSFYYSFVDRELLPSKVLMVDKGDAVVHYARDNSVLRIPCTQLFVPVTGDVLGSEQGTVIDCTYNNALRGASLTQGFVMSRILIILSCMMEDGSLTPLLLCHADRFFSLLNRLASVRIANDAPTMFLSEVRNAVAVTAQVARNQHLMIKKLQSFVPSTTTDAEKTVAFPVKAGMLVSIIEGPLRGAMFRAQSDGIDTFRAEPLQGGPSATIKAAACVPVKQAAGQPWWQVPNGLPCSLLEHTLRSDPTAAPLSPTVSNGSNALATVSIEGEWHGELITAQNANMSMTMSLVVGADFAVTGTARVLLADGRTMDSKVRGEHQRYSRKVKLVCSYSTVGPHMTLEELRQGLRGFGVIATPDATREEMMRRLIGLCESMPQPSWTLRGSLDAEGLRIAGMWKHSEGLSGSFTISSLRGVSLIPLSTPLFHVEPLPDCLDRVVPTAPPTDLYSMMHRLIVMLARHLYLVYVHRSPQLAKEISKSIILYHAHPLTERLIASLSEIHPQRFYRVLSEAISLVLDPHVKPWDSSTLSSIITKSVLLKSNTVEAAPSVYWDSLHAVVAAAHHCGEEYRHIILRNVVSLIEGQQSRKGTSFTELLTALCAWVDNLTGNVVGITAVRRDVAAGVELVLNVPKSIAEKTAISLPLSPLRCLVDLANSFRNNVPLPKAVEVEHQGELSSVQLEVLCPFGQYSDGELKVGKIMSNVRTSVVSAASSTADSSTAAITGKYYYEIALPERTIAPFAVGWGTQQHTDIPSQHVGSDVYSFAFSGNQVVMKQAKEEYKVGPDVVGGVVIGCLLDLVEKTAAWSINGIVGSFIPIPPLIADSELYAFTSTGSCSGMKIALASHQFQYLPDGYCDLAGRTSGITVNNFDESRSSLPLRPISFYAQVAAYLSDLQVTPSVVSASPTQSSPIATMPAATAAPADPEAVLRKYPQLAELTPKELDQAMTVVKVTESCMSTARRFIDLEGEIVEGALATNFLYMKQVVTRGFRRKLVEIPNVDKNNNPVNITIRFTELSSSLPRTAEVALHHSILSQLYRQIGSFTAKQMLQNPLFKVHLYLTSSGHTPQDMGGPYRQLWTLLSDEIMTHPDKCYPHSDFHRNPLFRFINNSQRVSLVPDHLASSNYELVLFTFLGKLLGHMARARTPLALDLSPFVWKFLVEDPLTIRDYYLHVDSVVERSVQDLEFLTSEVAEDVIPHYAEVCGAEIDRRRLTNELSLSDDEEIPFARRKQIAEDCLVHSMELQLNALRDGLWTVLPKRVTRCLCWQDLERAVCGDPLPSLDQMRDSIQVQMQPLREQFFWRLVEEMSGAQRSAFLCFSCGQKRLPLVKKIRVTENAESVDHLPRAQSCSALIAIPCYTSYEVFRAKTLMAIEHQTEMELA